uniref:Uncharacterized protein n=1 Tax=Caenorhabditis japonica TaxID=281687 RepID=A0A8R1HN83_CAEJA
MKSELEPQKFASSLTSTMLGSTETPSNIFLQVNPAQETNAKSETATNITFETIIDSEDDHVNSEYQLQQILDCILPPRVYEENGKLWKQQASLHPATRLDMVTKELREYELIRQVSVSCAERGLLLVRVRDEIRMTFSAYQNVLESAIAYGVRKALFIENEQTKASTEWKVQKDKNKELLQKIAQLEKKLATDKIVSEEELEIVEQRMKDTNERLVEANRILKNQLQSILQMDDMSQVKVADAVPQ